MKNLTFKTICVCVLVLLNFSFAKGVAEKAPLKLKHKIHKRMYPTSGINIVNTTGYTLSDIYISGNDANATPITPQEYTNLANDDAHLFTFDYGVESIQISVETAGGPTGPQYGIRIYDDDNNLILDTLKQDNSRSHTIVVPETFADADQLRVELYN